MSEVSRSAGAPTALLDDTGAVVVPVWLLLGGAWVVAGGLVAAVTGPTGWEHGSWVAAFGVLVAGVAQIGLGAGSAYLAPADGSRCRRLRRQGGGERLQAVLWNGGSLTVIAGTLLSGPLVVSAGGGLLAVALLRAVTAVRGAATRLRLVLAYRLLVLFVLSSIPVGLVLSWIRH